MKNKVTFPDGEDEAESMECSICSKITGSGMVETDELILGDVPWTKPEVRAVTVAKLDLLPRHRVLDIGAGTGTVTLEIARRVFAGQVLAVEMKEKAVRLLCANTEKFHLSHVKILQGNAPACLPAQRWDRIFIGGTGRNTQEILQYAVSNLKEDGIIVMNTVTLDSLTEAFTFLKEQEWTYEVILLQVSRTRKIGDYALYQGENPVHIITIHAPGLSKADTGV